MNILKRFEYYCLFLLLTDCRRLSIMATHFKIPWILAKKTFYSLKWTVTMAEIFKTMVKTFLFKTSPFLRRVFFFSFRFTTSQIVCSRSLLRRFTMILPQYLKIRVIECLRMLLPNAAWNVWFFVPNNFFFLCLLEYRTRADHAIN